MKFETKTLGQLSIDGKGHYGIAAPAVRYSQSLPTYLRITDIKDDGTINLDGVMSVDDPKSKYFLLRPNDIVFARTGASIGRNYFCEDLKCNLVYAGFLIKFSIDKRKINPKYIKYYCLSQTYKNWINSFSTGSTRGNINAKTYANMPILVPCRKHQDITVKILSALDDKIELNNRINKNLEAQAQAIYKHMFVENNNFQHKACHMEEYFEISIGKTPPRKEQKWFSTNSEDFNWVSISDMGNCGIYIGNSSEKITREAVDCYNIKVVPDNTVLLSFKLTVGRVAITYGEMTTNEAIAHFNTNRKEINEYLYFYLKSFNYQMLGSTSSIATAVNSKIIKEMQFIVPTEDEIMRFHNQVSPMFKKIKLNQIENVNLVNLRDTLLPKLMSGELNVSSIDLGAIV